MLCSFGTPPRHQHTRGAFIATPVLQTHLYGLLASHYYKTRPEMGSLALLYTALNFVRLLRPDMIFWVWFGRSN